MPIHKKPKATTTEKRKKRSMQPEDESDNLSISSSLSINWETDFPIKKQFYFNEKHSKFYETIKNSNTNMVFVDGPAGTAKSYIAVLSALELFKEKTTEHIMYVRSVVESASRSIGLLPGEVDDKFMPYAMPLIEKVQEISGKTAAANLKNAGILNAMPVNFARGLTFNNSIVIVDEAQNLSVSEITTILTRFGKNTRYVICGDTKQSDIGKASGFKEIYDKFNTTESESHGIYNIRFGESEIVRSKILKYIVATLEK